MEGSCPLAGWVLTWPDAMCGPLFKRGLGFGSDALNAVGKQLFRGRPGRVAVVVVVVVVVVDGAKQTIELYSASVRLTTAHLPSPTGIVTQHIQILQCRATCSSSTRLDSPPPPAQQVTSKSPPSHLRMTNTLSTHATTTSGSRKIQDNV